MSQNDIKYFVNKRDDKVYVSRRIQVKNTTENIDGYMEEIERPFRYISKIVNSTNELVPIKNSKEMTLRLTQGEKQEIVASVFEDTRGISVVKIQKYNKTSGSAYRGDWTLTGGEIRTFINFINSISFLPIEDSASHQQFTDDFLQKYILNKEQAIKLLSQYPDIISEIQKGGISTGEIVELSKRKQSLNTFKQLLDNDSSESEWQSFFEANTWIFGYGLNYVFNAPLEGKKLEQVVAGYNVNSKGKRVDALLARKGVVDTLCLVEIKKHTTKLLDKQYRPACFSVSEEVIGGIAQIQKTVQKSIESLSTSIQIKDDESNPVGKPAFNYLPKAYLVIGTLSEFVIDNTMNEEKYSSFELSRRNLSNPEIITFDELYERAKFIVATSEQKTAP